MKMRIFVATIILISIFSLHFFAASSTEANKHITVPIHHNSKSGRIMRGIASWYGKPFHGRLTANGERYNMYHDSAASRTLPLGSYLEVTNLANGKSVIVKVNDRGPYVSGRILDLSYGAAKKLGFVDNGLAHIEARLIKRDPVRFAQVVK